MGDVTIRSAVVDDVPGIRSILDAHGDDDPPDSPVDVIGPSLAHLLATGSVAVGEDAGSGRIVGFGAVVTNGRSTHLCDLFIHPDRLGAGIGRRLLAQLFVEPGPRTAFSSDDPRALPLYARLGMQPLWPNLYLDGDATRLPPLQDGIHCEPATPETLNRLEFAWTGVDRSADHAHWASLPEARPFVVTRSAEPEAIVHARRRRRGAGRWIERAVVAPDADPVPLLLAAFVEAADGGGPIAGCIPGPNPLLRPLLELGFRIVDRDTYMATPDVELDATRLMPHPGLL